MASDKRTLLKPSLMVIGLAGAGIYLSAMTFMMLTAIYHGYAVLVPDWLLLHGEPVLVAALALVCFYVSAVWFKALLKQ